MNIIYLKPSFEELRNLIYDLHMKLSSWRQDVNIGIGRGGLFVLRILQDYYIAAGVKLPYAVVAAERYTGVEEAGRLKVRGVTKGMVRGKRVLVIDDVADQGLTLAGVIREIKGRGALEVRTATVHVKVGSSFRPDYYVSETDAWIIYPWELYETIRQIIEARSKLSSEQIYWELTAKANILPEEIRKLNNITKGSALPEKTRELIGKVAEHAMA
ncbi:MAG: hypothetical protein JRN32_01345 [Nitrososphaerota archaeon]|nr:hypothetical protein [Nitrososphaerota archaeon]MDG7037917.1 hypothetical protein [Nitrososphaerota archaeon]MDG7045445.1 hypothetical protein [Nitrososphaerota archaeon]